MTEETLKCKNCNHKIKINPLNPTKYEHSRGNKELCHANLPSIGHVIGQSYKLPSCSCSKPEPIACACCHAHTKLTNLMLEKSYSEGYEKGYIAARTISKEIEELES